jgi:uncharacterized membrane protein YcjF (UPF0283 family)
MTRTVILLILLLAIYFIAELFQAVRSIYELNQYIGYLFGTVVFLLLGQLLVKYIIAALSIKKISPPPEYKNIDDPSQSDLQKYYQFLYLRQKALQIDFGISIEKALVRNPQVYSADLIVEGRSILEEMISPLDIEAEREIYKAIRDVMTGVIFSPFRSLDLVVVLYKNVQMVYSISKVYNTNPGTAIQMKILKDIMKLALTINVMNIGDKIVENILSMMPGTGQHAGDVAQGIGAGFFTSVIGFSTMRRCRNIDQWSVQEQQENIKNNIGSMMKVITKIIIKDAGPRLRSFFPDVKDIGEKIGNAIEKSFESTKDSMFRSGRDSSHAIKIMYQRIGRFVKLPFKKD